MSWVKFSVAVVVTSVVLVAAGAAVAANAFASSLPIAAIGGAGLAHGGGSWTVPPELASLKDLPADQRFAHFKGVQVNLTDGDGKPLAIAAVPGVVTSVSASSLTIAGNDGVSHTYTLDAQTITRGQAIATGKDVVVFTLNNSTLARGVVAATPGDWGHK